MDEQRERDPQRLFFDEVGVDYVVEITGYEKKDGYISGTFDHWYSIKEDIAVGHTKFKAGEKLHEKIQALDGVNTLVIKKVASPKYPHPYFSVEPAQNIPLATKASAPGPAAQEETVKAAGPERDRAKEHDILWREREERLSEAGHKPGDEDIPF